MNAEEKPRSILVLELGAGTIGPRLDVELVADVWLAVRLRSGR